MGRYIYPHNWRQMTPLERDNFHRHMGAFLRRARFLEHAWRDPHWRRRWWDGCRWRDHEGDVVWAKGGDVPME